MTNNDIVRRLILLRRWNGKTLEPSKMSNFTEHPNDYKYKTIIDPELSPGYIVKCINHLDKRGELLGCTPPNFITDPLISSKIYQNGTITDIIHQDDKVIWRFVKEDFSRKTLVDGHWKNFVRMSDALMFLNNVYSIPFTDIFTIKVGAISGLDEAFISDKGNVEFVTTQTPQTGKLKKMFFNHFDESLIKHKEKLLARRIKKFDENNWWMWGRSHHISNESRVYVPCKTRQLAPFFHHESIHYDGTILALFYKSKIKPTKIVNLLNKVNWEELGFKVNKRFIFSQKSLESIKLPKDFSIIYTEH